MNKIKLFVIASVGLFTVLISWQYINQYIYKPKAIAPTIYVRFFDGTTNISSGISINKNIEKIIQVKLTPNGTNKISGFSVNFYATGIKIINIASTCVSPCYFLEKSVNAEGNNASYTAVYKSSTLTGQKIIYLTIKGTIDGPGSLSLTNHDIVGPIAGYKYTTIDPIPAILNVTVGTPSPTPTLASPVCLHPTISYDNDTRKLKFHFDFEGKNVPYAKLWVQCYYNNETANPVNPTWLPMQRTNISTNPAGQSVLPYNGDTTGSLTCQSYDPNKPIIGENTYKIRASTYSWYDLDGNNTFNTGETRKICSEATLGIEATLRTPVILTSTPTSTPTATPTVTPGGAPSATPTQTPTPGPTNTGIPNCHCVASSLGTIKCSSDCKDSTTATLNNYACVSDANCSNNYARTKGDATGDGKACLDDYNKVLQGFYGQITGEQKLRADFNGDNEVGSLDINIFKDNFNSNNCLQPAD